jgi:hypothetical protein
MKRFSAMLSVLSSVAVRSGNTKYKAKSFQVAAKRLKEI